MRKAFGLPQALLIIIFIGSIVLIGIKYTKVGVNHYGDTYINEQAKLFLQSTKEWALLQISGEKCWKGGSLSHNSGNIVFNANIEVEKYYLINTSECSGVDTEEIKTLESNGYVKLKIAITDSLQKVKLIDRSIQRP